MSTEERFADFMRSRPPSNNILNALDRAFQPVTPEEHFENWLLSKHPDDRAGFRELWNQMREAEKRP